MQKTMETRYRDRITTNVVIEHSTPYIFVCGNILKRRSRDVLCPITTFVVIRSLYLVSMVFCTSSLYHFTFLMFFILVSVLFFGTFHVLSSLLLLRSPLVVSGNYI